MVIIKKPTRPLFSNDNSKLWPEDGCPLPIEGWHFTLGRVSQPDDPQAVLINVLLIVVSYLKHDDNCLENHNFYGNIVPATATGLGWPAHSQYSAKIVAHININICT